MNLICFSQYYYSFFFLWIFIEHQSHRSSKNNPQLKWRSWEAYSSTKYYSVQKQRSNYQPAQYDEYHHYFHDRIAQSAFSYNAYEKVKVDHKISIIVEYQTSP